VGAANTRTWTVQQVRSPLRVSISVMHCLSGDSMGWVNTGSDGGSSWENPVPGVANCLNYAVGGGHYYGTVVKLPGTWADPAAGGVGARVGRAAGHQSHGV
jgi:hypothetical protein